MEVPVQVTFRDMPVSDAIEAACHAEAEKLERCFDRITSCRVVVAVSHHRHTKGNLFEIRIELGVPGRQIVVSREPAAHHRDEDLGVALHEAFARARRQLEDHVRRQRGQTKGHEKLPHGRVGQLFPEDGYGFIETPEGREIYFHRNSVIDGFDRLDVGSEVCFAEEPGEKGPQASTVSLVGWHERADPPDGLTAGS